MMEKIFMTQHFIQIFDISEFSQYGFNNPFDKNKLLVMVFSVAGIIIILKELHVL